MLCKDNYNFYYLENHAEDIADDYQKISNFVKYHFGYSKEYEFLLNCRTSFKIIGGKIKKDSYCFVLEV